MAADCHAKNHIDGGPPQTRRLPPPQTGYVDDARDQRIPFTAMVVEPGAQEFGICDICGLEPEEDPWKGGNDPWIPLKTNLPFEVPMISNDPTAKSTMSAVSMPTLLECYICRNDGVYDRFEAATANVSRTFIPDVAGWAGDIVRGPSCHGETHDDQPPTGNDRFEPVRLMWISAPYLQTQGLSIWTCQTQCLSIST